MTRWSAAEEIINRVLGTTEAMTVELPQRKVEDLLKNWRAGHPDGKR